jgi:hypothetical protein
MHDELRPLTAPPRRWRMAKYAMALAFPVGIAFVAHRVSEPEGLGAAELSVVATPENPARAEAAASRSDVVRLPARAFTTNAFGHSGAVRVRVALPKDPVALPMVLRGSTDGMQAQWIAFDGKANDATVPWPSDAVLRAPTRPGAFWLVLSRGGVADTVADLALFVEHPMPNRMATGINGYHMGRWPRASDGIVPRGFIEVTERISDFPLSPHLKLSDFVVHDAQDGFPKYLHVREQLLDKVELTVAEIAQMRGRNASEVTLHVASGFRSPAHNGQLSGTAQDSRHMFGDAADIAIDANNDGRLTELDARLVASAAEIVERKHPDLVGGIGLYITSDGGGWPYVHIDVRGNRARWRGGVRRGAVVDSLLPADATFDSVAAAVKASTAAEPAPAAAARVATPSAAAPSATVKPLVRPTRASSARRGAAPRKPQTVSQRKARPSSRGATGIIIRSEAAYARSGTSRPSPAASNPRTVDDPFSSAAAKFRATRP